MLIPLRHESMEGRRWPVITFALIALNILIFLGTHWKIEEQDPQRLEVNRIIRPLTNTKNWLKAHSTERQSLLALLSAGRLSLKKLSCPADALLYYQAAKTSSAPHLDWDSNIGEWHRGVGKTPWNYG